MCAHYIPYLSVSLSVPIYTISFYYLLLPDYTKDIRHLNFFLNQHSQPKQKMLLEGSLHT